jgi:hypothetical protein
VPAQLNFFSSHLRSQSLGNWSSVNEDRWATIGCWNLQHHHHYYEPNLLLWEGKPLLSSSVPSSLLEELLFWLWYSLSQPQSVTHNQSVLVSFLSLWQNTWDEELKEEKFYFGSWFQRLQSMLAWPSCF